MTQVRGYRDADRAAVYDICVRTGAAGGDARGRHSRDELLGDLFAGPYVTMEPGLAFVLDDGGRVVGYVLGTADTTRFALRWAVEWTPRLADRYPPPHADADRHLLELGFHPERMLHPELASHPAHLHIDLLPEWQGKGQGRGLMAAFLTGLRAAGVPRVHLGMAPENHGAHAFYQRLGFRDLPVQHSGALYLGRDTSPL